MLLERLHDAGTGDQDTESLLRRMNNQVDRMVSLIKELLDTTRITTGKFSLKKESFDVITMIKEVTETVQYTTKDHILQLKLKELPHFNGDRQRIEQILINLLDNAIKYAPDSNEIIVSSDIVDDKIYICVQDFGKGLSEKIKKNLFEKFYRDENTFYNNSLGLGLFISMEIAKLHRGTIKVETSEGKGAKFCLTLPLN